VNIVTPAIFRWRRCEHRVAVCVGRGQLKYGGTRAETIFRLPVKRTSPFKSGGGRQFSRLLGSRGVRISGSNFVYATFRGSVKGTGCPLHSPVSPSLPLSCVTVCHHVLTGVYLEVRFQWKHLQNYLIHMHMAIKHRTLFQNGGHYVACFIVCDSKWGSCCACKGRGYARFLFGSADPPYWHVVLEPAETVIQRNRMG
jgi:hypothetical protein